MDADFPWRLDSKANFVAANLNDHDRHVVADYDLLVFLPAEYEHRPVSLISLDRSAEACLPCRSDDTWSTAESVRVAGKVDQGLQWGCAIRLTFMQTPSAGWHADDCSAGND